MLFLSMIALVIARFIHYVLNLMFSKIFAHLKIMLNAFSSPELKCFDQIVEENLSTPPFKYLLSSTGIVHQLSCPHILEQNGVAECRHCHIVETGLSLLAHSSLPTNYWFEAFNTAVYLINRMPIVSKVSPYEALFHAAPDYTPLCIFGCACYPWLRPYQPCKLDFKLIKCVFLGYSLSHKGYRCLDPSTGRIYISRHVIFYEQTFPFLMAQSNIPPLLHLTPIHSSDNQPTCPLSTLPPAQLPFNSLPQSPSPCATTSCPTLVLVLFHHPHVPSHTHSMSTRSQSGNFKKKIWLSTKHPLPCALLATSQPAEPKCYMQAVKSSNLRAAMDMELTSYSVLRLGHWFLMSHT